MDDSNIPGTSSSTPMKTSSETIKDVEGATKRLKIEQLYSFLKAEGDANTIDVDKFKVTRNTKTGRTMLYFFKDDGGKITLSKNNAEFISPNEIKRGMGGLDAIKGMLGLNETLPLLEKSIQAAARDLNKTNPTYLEMEDIQYNLSNSNFKGEK